MNRQLEGLHRERWRAASIEWKYKAEYGAIAGLNINATRFFGASSLSASSHLAPIDPSNNANPVVLPPGMCQALDETLSDWIRDVNEYNGKRAGRVPCGSKCWRALSDN